MHVGLADRDFDEACLSYSLHNVVCYSYFRAVDGVAAALLAGHGW